MNLRACLIVAALWATARAQGRPPAINAVRFGADGNAINAIYVGSTFGLLASPDGGCTMRWACEADLGYAGTWDPKYAIGSDGTIFATTFSGLAISRDGGCTFTKATGRIAGAWIDAIDLAPAGDVWVTTAISGAPNDVYVSRDGGGTFAPVGLSSPRIFWKSVRVAPSEPARVYTAGYEVAPPTGHLEVSRDGGRSWTASALGGVAFGATPIVLVAAVDPHAADTFYLISERAAPTGDRLYRTTDGGRTFHAVLDAPGPIGDVVVRGRDVWVATLRRSGAQAIGGPVFRATDGETFAAVPDAPPLSCLGLAPDGTLVGCARTALVRARTPAGPWTPLWRFGELAGALDCPAGTPAHDRCNLAEVRPLLGPHDPGCTPGPPDETAAYAPTPPRGCAAGGDSPWAVALALASFRKGFLRRGARSVLASLWSSLRSIRLNLRSRRRPQYH